MKLHPVFFAMVLIIGTSACNLVIEETFENHSVPVSKEERWELVKRISAWAPTFQSLFHPLLSRLTFKSLIFFLVRKFA